MDTKVRELLVTLVRLASYHSGELVVDWLRARCAGDKLIYLREYVEIGKELERLGIPWHEMNMGTFAAHDVWRLL